MASNGLEASLQKAQHVQGKTGLLLNELEDLLRQRSSRRRDNGRSSGPPSNVLAQPIQRADTVGPRARNHVSPTGATPSPLRGIATTSPPRAVLNSHGIVNGHIGVVTSAPRSGSQRHSPFPDPEDIYPDPSGSYSSAAPSRGWSAPRAGHASYHHEVRGYSSGSGGLPLMTMTDGRSASARSLTASTPPSADDDAADLSFSHLNTPSPQRWRLQWGQDGGASDDDVEVEEEGNISRSATEALTAQLQAAKAEADQLFAENRSLVQASSAEEREANQFGDSGFVTPGLEEKFILELQNRREQLFAELGGRRAQAQRGWQMSAQAGHHASQVAALQAELITSAERRRALERDCSHLREQVELTSVEAVQDGEEIRVVSELLHEVATAAGSAASKREPPLSNTTRSWRPPELLAMVRSHLLDLTQALATCGDGKSNCDLAEGLEAARTELAAQRDELQYWRTAAEQAEAKAVADRVAAARLEANVQSLRDWLQGPGLDPDVASEVADEAGTVASSRTPGSWRGKASLPVLPPLTLPISSSSAFVGLPRGGEHGLGRGPGPEHASLLESELQQLADDCAALQGLRQRWRSTVTHELRSPIARASAVLEAREVRGASPTDTW